MNYSLIVLFSFSIAIPAILGWIRFGQIDASFYPFIYCMWLGLINETISYIVTLQGHYTAINNNIYVLIESVLLAWQFKNWGLFYRKKYFFWIIIFLFLAVWVAENFFLANIYSIVSYFRITYSFTIVLMSIHLINDIMFRERGNFLKNATFVICVGFVIYYTYKVLVEVFWVYGLNNGKNFRMRIYDILAFVNLLSILMYGFAVLWIPKKQRFTLPS